MPTVKETKKVRLRTEMLLHQFEDLELNLTEGLHFGREPLSSIQDTRIGELSRANLAKEEDADDMSSYQIFTQTEMGAG